MRIRAISIIRTRAVIAGGALILLVTILITPAASPRPTDAEVADIQSSVKALVNTTQEALSMPSAATAEPSGASIASLRSKAASVFAASMTADLAAEVMSRYDPYLNALERGEIRIFVTGHRFSDWVFTHVSLDKSVAHAEGTVTFCLMSIDYAETPPATRAPCGGTESKFAVTLVRRDGRWVLSQYEMNPIQAP